MSGGVLIEAALGEEAPPHLGGRGAELLAVVLLRDRMGIQQPAAGAEIGAIAAPLPGLGSEL